MKDIYSYVEIRTALNIEPHTIYTELKHFYADKAPDERTIEKIVYRCKNARRLIERSQQLEILPENTHTIECKAVFKLTFQCSSDTCSVVVT